MSLHRGGEVRVSVEPIYLDDGLRPVEYDITWTIDSETFNETLPNA